MFGGDGANTPSPFKVPGSYVSNFAPDISGVASSKALIDGWKKDNPECASSARSGLRLSRGRGRAERDQEDVRRGRTGRSRTGGSSSSNVKKINLKTSIRWARSRFSTKSNDPLNAKFYIFQIQSNGTYKLVG